MLAFALFYSKKLGHQLVEGAHWDQLGDCPIFEALRNNGGANLRPRIGEGKPDSVADRLRGQTASGFPSRILLKLR